MTLKAADVSNQVFGDVTVYMVCWLANSYTCYGVYGLLIGEQLHMLRCIWSVDWRTVTHYGIYGMLIGEQLHMLWCIWSVDWPTVTHVKVYMVCWLANSYTCYGVYGMLIGEQLHMLWCIWYVDWQTVTHVMVYMVCWLTNSYTCYGVYGMLIDEQLHMLWSIWSVDWQTVTHLTSGVVFTGCNIPEDLYHHECYCENLQSHGISNPQGGGCMRGKMWSTSAVKPVSAKPLPQCCHFILICNVIYTS